MFYQFDFFSGVCGMPAFLFEMYPNKRVGMSFFSGAKVTVILSYRRNGLEAGLDCELDIDMFSDGL